MGMKGWIGQGGGRQEAGGGGGGRRRRRAVVEIKCVLEGDDTKTHPE